MIGWQGWLGQRWLVDSADVGCTASRPVESSGLNCARSAAPERLPGDKQETRSWFNAAGANCSNLGSTRGVKCLLTGGFLPVGSASALFCVYCFCVCFRNQPYGCISAEFRPQSGSQHLRSALGVCVCGIFLAQVSQEELRPLVSRHGFWLRVVGP